MQTLCACSPCIRLVQIVVPRPTTILSARRLPPRHRRPLGSSRLIGSTSVAMAAPSGTTEWSDLSEQYASGMWLKDRVEIPAVKAMIEEISPDLRANGRNVDVLDIGCGAGKYSILSLAAGAESVVGVDLSQEMVDVAAKVCSAWKEEEPGREDRAAEFFAASATDMRSVIQASSCPTKEFSLALVAYVLCNLESREQVVQALRVAQSCMCQGGRLVIVDKHPMGFGDVSTPFVRQTEDEAFKGYYSEGLPLKTEMKMGDGNWISFTNRRWTLSTWVQMIGEAGFRIVRVEEPHLSEVDAGGDPELQRYVTKPLFVMFVCEKL